MQTKDATEILKSLGWEPYRDEVGDTFAYYYLPDRVVDLSYGVKHEKGSERFWLSASLTTVPYCLAREYARGKKSRYGYILFPERGGFGITVPELLESHVEAALNNVIIWAQTLDIKKKLLEEATDHSLVAKALLGDMKALKSYKLTPKLDVPEFSDYKTTTWNERLLLFAQAYKNGELNDIIACKKLKGQQISLKAATTILKINGWCATEPANMWLSLPDRFIKFDFDFGCLNDKQNFHIELEMSTEEISSVCRYIHKSGKYDSISPTNIYLSFNSLGNGLDICLDTLTRQELIKISERVIQWARAQDLEATMESKTHIQTYRCYPDILWHFTCLALTGKIDVLKSYQNSISEGKISEHLQSLDEELETYINRAIEFAEEHLTVLKEREAADARIGVQSLAFLNTVSEKLKMMGWTVYRDKNYERNAYFISKDRIINIVYSLDMEGETPTVALKASLSTLGFSTIHRYISPDKPQYIALKEAEEIYTVSGNETASGNEVDEDKLKQICADILDWADRQNVNQIIYDYADLSANSEFDLVLRHFVALVLIGDVEKLKFYKKSFRAGNRLGFVKEITKDIIDDIFWFARRYRSGFPKNVLLLALELQTTPVDSVEEVDETDDNDDALTIESTAVLLKSLGWSVEKIDGDDHLASYQLPDREVQILYNDESVKDCPQFDVGFLVVTGILATACKVINPTYSEDLEDLQLNFEEKGLEIFEVDVTADCLTQALDDALEWAVQAIDLHEELRSQYGMPPWKKSKINEAHYGLLHIGALALLGDVETLQSYQKSFAAGDPLGFDESINKTHLERAVALAQEVAKVKQLSYALIEQVSEKLDN
ncbi:DUF6990 domain-containing protein, partial [Bartonella jaculi]|uniref:DUF6990 domain-containing protein n=1 Tax=Bartonella jaculi TaxID=686226 RepID=UPI0031EB4532